MKKTAILGTLTVAALAAGAAGAATLDEVKARGTLNCGVATGLVGFAAPDANGEWSGFDVGVCRAVAAAVLGDPTAVEFVPTTGKTRFTSLASGEIDMLARNTTWTFSRDTDLKFDFVGVNYYDGQGFMVPKALGVSSAKELSGATVCIQTGTTTELNLADYFRKNNMDYQPVPIETNAEAQQQYLAGACDVYTTDASGLAATRAAFENPGDHVVLPEIISKEPLGPLVRHGDNDWGGRRALDLLRAGRCRRVRHHLRERRRALRRHGKSGNQPDPRHRRQSRCDAGAGADLGQGSNLGRRQLRRVVRKEHRREHPDRTVARPQRAMDRWWPDVRTAVPLIRTVPGRGGHASALRFL